MVCLEIQLRRSRKHGARRETMSLAEMVVCPECRGEKTMFGLACREAEPCKPFMLACRFCKGVGAVSPALAHIYERGVRMRKERVRLGRTLH
jgi:uncharacterized protein YbaR (Trm112 family)